MVILLLVLLIRMKKKNELFLKTKKITTTTTYLTHKMDTKTITLETINGHSYDADFEAIVNVSDTIKNQTEDSMETDEKHIVLIQCAVDNKDVLRYITEYCKHRMEHQTTYDRLEPFPDWEKEYIEKIGSTNDIVDMLIVADFLAIQPLVSFLTLYLARQHKNETKKIAEMYEVEDKEAVPTEEERAEIRKVYPWCMDI